MDIIVEIAVSAACTAAEWLVAPVGRHCCYLIRSDHYVRQLNNEVQKLEAQRDGVQRRVEKAGCDLKEIKPEVITWKNNAEKVIETARSMPVNDGKTEKTCFYGWLPNPKARYCIGRDARNTADDIQKLIQEGKFGPVDDDRAAVGLVHRAPPENPSAGDGGHTITDPRASKKTCFCGWLSNPIARYRLGGEAKDTVKDGREVIPRGQSPKVDSENDPSGLGGATDSKSLAGDGGGTITDSRASLCQDIMKALDDEKLKVIGVYGPGGVGKTTLLDEVEKKLRKEGRPFHMIATSKVSQSPDLKKIQDDIASALGLNLKDETSDEVRKRLLFQRLENDPTKKVLIILDDLWKQLNLREVGIPSGDESRGCQVLLTSRYRDVLQNMSASRIFSLEGLKHDEALKLFEKMVGDKLQDNEELKAMAPQVVEKLAGLPLLIKSVAAFLKDKNAHAWRCALIRIDAKEIETIVTLSYEHLESEETKSLFLLCGLIGGTIRVEALLMLGVGLDLFGEFGSTMRGSRDRLHTMLDELRSVCLLLDGGGDKENVTIHDLYSEVVVSTPFRDQNSLRMNSNDGSWPKEKLEKCWAMCLVNVVGDRLVELMQGGCPDLKVLMLSQSKLEHWLYGRPAHRHEVEDCCRLDFTYKKELQVLFLRSMQIPNLPPSIEILENLQSLYLDNCYVEDVAILGKLKALQILSFAGSSISSLPQEIGKLTKLKLLNLSRCNKLVKIEPGVLKGLINLEELYMRYSFNKWMGEDEISSELCNVKLAELKSLTKLTALEISIPDPTVLLKDGDLPFGNLIRFWINIGNTSVSKLEDLTSMILDLKGCDSILSKEWVQKTLQKTQYLRLDGLRDSKKSAHELCSRGFPKLKHLDIRNCSSIKQIVSSSDGAFPILESLFLNNLINLDKISDGPECFSQLKVIEVTKCDRLENLWRLTEMHRLAQLEKIAVRKCDSVRAIVIDDERKDAIVGENRVELPNLRRLELTRLPKMMSFCIEGGITSDGAPEQVWIPRLESLEMEGLLDWEEILYGQPPSAYSNLKLIQIGEFKSTSSSILKSDWIVQLPNLESLDIRRSPSAEVVFDLEELKGTGHVEILSRLTELRLNNLPNLQCMCKENAQLKGISVFRKLKELRVSNIGLAFLFPVSVAKCLREIRRIEVSGCGKMEALVVDEDGRDQGTNDIIEFPLLERLITNDCPMMKSFSNFCRKKESVPITSDSQDAYSDSFFDSKVSLPSLKRLQLSSVGSFKSIWPRELPESSFDIAELVIAKCSELPNVFPLSIMGRLHNLTHVEIRKCPSLETVFECGPLESNTTEQTGVVPVSKAIRLDSQTVLALPNLEAVTVEECSKLRYLFPYDVATALEKLEWLRIWDCEQMKEVVTKEGGGQSKADVLTFRFLTSLSISQCPNFRAFISNPASVERLSGETAKENGESQQPLFSEMVTFPSLNNVYITGVRVKELWSNQSRDDFFCNLRSLELMECENLQRIAPSHVWKRLRHSLEMLKVTSCRLIEIIDDDDAAIVETGQLRILVLDDLENLRHIWRYDNLPNINVPFPNLRDIEVRRCPRLTTLFETFTASFLGQIKWLEVESCEDMELIADHGECEGATCTTITFSELDALKLEEMPKFRGYLPEKYHVEFPSHMRAFIRVGCGKEPDQSDGSNPHRWEQYRDLQRYTGYWG